MGNRYSQLSDFSSITFSAIKAARLACSLNRDEPAELLAESREPDSLSTSCVAELLFHSDIGKVVTEISNILFIQQETFMFSYLVPPVKTAL